MTPVLERIARDIRSGYTVGYVPPPGDPTPRRPRVRVDVRAPDGRKLAVRARSSYINSHSGEVPMTGKRPALSLALHILEWVLLAIGVASIGWLVTTRVGLEPRAGGPVA